MRSCQNVDDISRWINVTCEAPEKILAYRQARFIGYSSIMNALQLSVLAYHPRDIPSSDIIGWYCSKVKRFTYLRGTVETLTDKKYVFKILAGYKG